MPVTTDNALGAFLKDRRGRLDPARFGLPSARRRTPGLRREEVAQRAEMSATWYTWLEQGRGGAPSSDVLERLSDALTLSAAEREHLFLLAQRRPPRVLPASPGPVSPRLQAVLDGLESCPALVVTPVWDVAAWNVAAAAVMTDYGALAPDQRNILRMFFGPLQQRAAGPEWERNARHVVAAFRLSTRRSGAPEAADALVAELSSASPRFAAIWAENDVHAHGEGAKRILRPDGPLDVNFSTLAVDGRPDLSLLVYTPLTEGDRERIRVLVEARRAAGG